MIRVCPGEIGKPSRMTSPRGLESSLTKSECQPQVSRDLIDVVNILPQYGCVVAAARVVAFNDLNANAIKGLIVQALKVLLCQGHPRELLCSFFASRMRTFSEDPGYPLMIQTLQREELVQIQRTHSEALPQIT